MIDFFEKNRNLQNSVSIDKQTKLSDEELLERNKECDLYLSFAITNYQNPKELKSNVLETAASFIASGLDPKKNIIFSCFIYFVC